MTVPDMTKQCKVIEIEETASVTLESQLRGAIYAAHAYHDYPIIRCGHRESIVLPIWEYDRLVEIANAAKDLLIWIDGKAVPKKAN